MASNTFTPIWNAFLRQVALTGLALGLLTAAAPSVITGYRFDIGLMAVVLMALNALGAIGPLVYRQGKNPASNPMGTYMLSMLVRMAAIGAFTIALVLQPSFGMSEALSFVLTAMVGFVVFTGLEVRLLIRHQATLFGAPRVHAAASPSLKTQAT
jgi:hypothetical protein